MIRYIDAHRERFGVEPICRMLQVGTSSYYAARRTWWSATSVPLPRTGSGSPT